jgi:hypothetical protein
VRGQRACSVPRGARARNGPRLLDYCNATSAKQADYWRQGSPRKQLSGFDLCKLTAGYAEYCEYITADTIQRIAFEHPEKLRIAKDAAFERLKNAKTEEERASARKTIARLTSGKLRWRASYGAKRALGWIPFKGVTIKRKARNSFQYAGKRFRVFKEDYLPPDAKWRAALPRTL